MFLSLNKLLSSLFSTGLATGGLKNESTLSLDVTAVLTSVDPTNSLAYSISGLSFGIKLMLFYKNGLGFATINLLS